MFLTNLKKFYTKFTPTNVTVPAKTLLNCKVRPGFFLDLDFNEVVRILDIQKLTKWKAYSLLFHQGGDRDLKTGILHTGSCLS